jgi:hypothetical protein
MVFLSLPPGEMMQNDEKHWYEFLHRQSLFSRAYTAYNEFINPNPPLAGLHQSEMLAIMEAMDQYEYHLGIRLDGKYYFSIYLYGIPGPIAFTDDFETEEEAIEAAKEIVSKLHAKFDAP